MTFIMKCKNCNNECNDNAKFCPKCGNKLEQIPICQGCGNILDPSVKFCPNCGTPNSNASQNKDDMQPQNDPTIPANLLYRFPEGANLSELAEAVKNYNAKATEYGSYTLFELNSEKRFLTGEFHEKNTVGLGFGKMMKVTWQNSKMETDYETVCKIAAKLAKLKNNK